MIDLPALDRLLRRITRSAVELDACFADRAGYATRLGLVGETHDFVLRELAPQLRERLALCRRHHADALAAELRDALPHTLDTLARHRPVDDDLWDQFSVAELSVDGRDRVAAFGRFVGALALPCNYLGDLAALERAVGRTRAARPRLLALLAADAPGDRFALTDGKTLVGRNRLANLVELGHDLPWADFPAHISGRPPVTWPATLAARRFTVAVSVAPEPPHHVILVELDAAGHALLERATGSISADALAASVGAPRSAVSALAAVGLIGVRG